MSLLTTILAMSVTWIARLATTNPAPLSNYASSVILSVMPVTCLPLTVQHVPHLAPIKHISTLSLTPVYYLLHVHLAHILSQPLTYAQPATHHVQLARALKITVQLVC